MDPHVIMDRGQLLHSLLRLARKAWHRLRGFYAGIAGRLVSGLGQPFAEVLRRINQTYYELLNTAGENWEAHPKTSQGSAQGRFRYHDNWYIHLLVLRIISALSLELKLPSASASHFSFPKLHLPALA